MPTNAPAGARAVIVTGGTGGLGPSVVRLLLEQGSRVAVSYRREEEWRALADAARSDRLYGHPADLADASAARAFVDASFASLGGLDGVALVAGGWAGGSRFEEAPADEWSRMLRVNLDTVAHVCRAAIPRLADGGSVVAVGSRAAQAAPAGHGGLRRLEGGRARARAGARAREPGPRHPLQRGAPGDDRHRREPRGDARRRPPALDPTRGHRAHDRVSPLAALGAGDGRARPGRRAGLEGRRLALSSAAGRPGAAATRRTRP